MSLIFPLKQSRDILYASEINSVLHALQNIEEAIGLQRGTSLAQIEGSQLAAGIPGEKIDPQSSLSVSHISAANSFTFSGWGSIGADVEISQSGVLRIKDQNQSRDVIVLGRLSSSERGIKATDSEGQTTFSIQGNGSLYARGAIHAESGSSFKGSVEVEGGYVLGSLFLRDSSYVHLDGVAGKILLGPEGEITAGASSISPLSGIKMRQGSISLGAGKFHLQEDGTLFAHGATIIGELISSSGSVGGIDIDEEGLHVGGVGDSTSGFSLTSTGYLYARQGSFTGSIHAESGTLGTLEVTGVITAGGAQISSSGISLTSGSINLGGGRFVVDSAGNLTAQNASIIGHITATSGEFSGPVTAGSSVTISSDGILIDGEAGLRVMGDKGVEVEGGSIVVLHPQASHPVIQIGQFLSKGSTRTGLLVLHGAEEVFRVDEQGDAYFKGTIEAEAGTFSGTVHAQSGSFGNVSITNEVIVSGQGVIKAGDTELGPQGLHLAQGSINLNNQFIVTESGHLTAQGAEIHGEINATGGMFSGDVSVGTGVMLKGSESQIVAGSTILSSTGLHMRTGSTIQMGDAFYVTSTGELTANQATIRGDITVDSGTVRGEFFVGDGVRMASSRIDVIGEEGVSLRGGSLVVRDLESDQPIAEMGTFHSPVIWPGIDLDAEYAVDVIEGMQDGDGETTVFYVASIPILENSLNITINDAEVQDYSVNYTTGEIVFSVPPPAGAQLKAEYKRIARQSGIRVSDGQRDTLLITRDGKLRIYGTVEAEAGYFGSGEHRINIDEQGVYSGVLGDLSSPFGIYVSGEKAGDAYFRGTVQVMQDSVIQGDISVNEGGKIYAGTPDGARVEMTHGGLFAYDENNVRTFELGGAEGTGIFTGAINASGGTITGNLTITHEGSDIRIVGNPGQQNVDKAGIYIYEPDPGTGIMRLTDIGLQYRPDTSSTWQDAINFKGIDAHAITDGIFRIHDSTQASGLEVWRKVNRGGIEEDRLVVDIKSDHGIRIHDGALEVVSDATGETLIGGGYVRVRGLDVGVFQSDNYVLNGNFNTPSTKWGTAQTNEGKAIPGFPSYGPPDSPYFGDYFIDRLGRLSRLGSAYWTPSKSDTVLNAEGEIEGYAKIGFATEDFLHTIFGYCDMEVGGATESWAQIEQDVYPWYNHTNGRYIIPGEQHRDVVVSAGFHWHAGQTTRNTVTIEVDELVPNYVFVESDRLEPFVPVWDNVHGDYAGNPYEGIRYFNADGSPTSPGEPGSDWDLDDDTWRENSSGDNWAYNKHVSSNAVIEQGTEHFVVDNMFVFDDHATKTVGSGHHYIQVDLGEVRKINQVWSWHSANLNKTFYNHRIEISDDGVNWEEIHFAAEAQGGRLGHRVTFETRDVRYIRDWIEGGIESVFDPVTETSSVVEFEQNQWLEIWAHYNTVAKTSVPGAYFEWDFRPHSRADLWISFIKAYGHGIGKVEINGVQVATIDQGAMIEGHGHEGDLSYIDVSSQEDFQIVPKAMHTMRITFEDTEMNYDEENNPKVFTFDRIKLEDFRSEEGLTTISTVASGGITPIAPYGFFFANVVPVKAKDYVGQGRQIVKGMFDNALNFSEAGVCWLRYRVRIRSHSQAGGDPHGHDHVMISHVILEEGTQHTSFRRSSLDEIPTFLLRSWDEDLPHITGIHEKHIADLAVTDRKIADVDWSKIRNVPSDIGGLQPSEVGEGLRTEEVGGKHHLHVDFDEVARKDHSHNSLDASGLFTLRRQGLALDLRPSGQNTNEEKAEVVSLVSELPVVLDTNGRPIGALTEVVKSLDGTKTYVRGEDYEIDYWNRRIWRLQEGDIGDPEEVVVSYVMTTSLMAVTGAGGNRHFELDSRGNIKANSIRVSLSTGEEAGAGASGDFTVEGNLLVEGSTVLGDSNADTTSILGGLSVINSSTGLPSFSVDSAGVIHHAAIGWGQIGTPDDPRPQHFTPPVMSATKIGGAKLGTGLKVENEFLRIDFGPGSDQAARGSHEHSDYLSLTKDDEDQIIQGAVRFSRGVHFARSAGEGRDRPPFTVNSNVMVTNLNAQMVGGRSLSRLSVSELGKEIHGPGVYSGLLVTQDSPAKAAVKVGPGIAYSPGSGRRLLYESSSEYMVTELPYARKSIVVVVGESRVQRKEDNPNEFIELNEGDIAIFNAPQGVYPSLPLKHDKDILLAVLDVPANDKTITNDQISIQRQWQPWRWIETTGELLGYTIDDGRDPMSVTTTSKVRFSLSAETKKALLQIEGDIHASETEAWSDAAEKRHAHIYNESPVKDTSDASGKSYLLSYEPADDNLQNELGRHINIAGKKIMVFKNGLLQRPFNSSSRLEQYDYHIINNRIVFRRAPKPEDMILAFYEIK